MSGHVIIVEGSIWQCRKGNLDYVIWAFCARNYCSQLGRPKRNSLGWGLKDESPFDGSGKVTVNEWKTVKSCSISRICGFICKDYKITFPDNIIHELYRKELSFKIYEHPSPSSYLSFKILYLQQFRDITAIKWDYHKKRHNLFRISIESIAWKGPWPLFPLLSSS